MSFGMWQIRTNVSEERTAYIFKAQEKATVDKK
jgi:hypothetical protein